MPAYGDYHVSILTKLWMRGLFGGKYQPVEQLFSDIPRERYSDAREAMDDLHQDGLVVYHKKGNCASINPRYKDRVRTILREAEDVPSYVPDLH